MAYLKNRDTGDVLTRYVTLDKQQELTISTKTALDGTEYLTRIGSPVYTYSLEVITGEGGKEALMEAFDTLALIEVGVRRGVFTGRIKDLGKFETIHYGWYKTTVLLSSVYEVNVR